MNFKSELEKMNGCTVDASDEGNFIRISGIVPISIDAKEDIEDLLSMVAHVIFKAFVTPKATRAFAKAMKEINRSITEINKREIYDKALNILNKENTNPNY